MRSVGVRGLKGASQMRIPIRRPVLLFALTVAAWLVSPPTAGAAKAPERRDVVVMKNGDRITGKIKKLDHGQLYIEPPYVVAPIPVDWLQADRIETTAKFQLEMSGGKRLVGTIQKIPTKENPNQDFVITNAGSRNSRPRHRRRRLPVAEKQFLATTQRLGQPGSQLR